MVIEPISCLKDNYAYLLFAPGEGNAYVVDPSEPAPIEAALRRHGLVLRGILATHHHVDHVGGIEALRASELGRDAWVAAHRLDAGRVPALSHAVDAPADSYVLVPELGLVAGCHVVARHIPGHTRAAIAWGLLPVGPAGTTQSRTSFPLVPTDLFTGDTLFGAGCGRLFEGTPADMFASLRALTDLPPATRLWFGHEYTASNLQFAAVIEPGNAEVRARASALNVVTTPSTVGLERDTNPFVRASSVDELAARRAAKDAF